MFGEDIALCVLQLYSGGEGGGDGGKSEERVMFRVHVIPWSFRQRVHEALTRARTPLLAENLAADALARLAIEAMTLRRTRQLLATLDLLRLEIQGTYDTMRRSQARASGRPACLASIPHPLLAHDACTLYSALALALASPAAARRRALAHVAGRASLPARCEACGLEKPWAVSCFVPRASVRGGMRLEPHDEPVAWCWECRSHPPAAAAVVTARGD
jgi:hypothetical protein